MKDISYDLIDKLRKYKDEKDPAGRILNESRDGESLYALSPIRENLISWADIGKDMEVLQYGADYGSFTKVLSERAGSVDVYDSKYERSEVIKERYPDITASDSGNVRILKKIPAKKYDLVFCTEITTEMTEEFGGSLEGFVRMICFITDKGCKRFLLVAKFTTLVFL